MKPVLVIAVTLAAATAFAADVPQTQHARILITNNGTHITAYRFAGDIRQAILSLRSAPIRQTPFGSAVFNANAAFSAPPHLAAVIGEASRAHGVDPRLLTAVARQESALNPGAVSPVGACGIMQLMPATARFLGVTNVFDARENVFGGARYLRTLLDTFHGDLDLTLAAYNAGPGAVQKYRGVPPYRETQSYVKNVRRMYEAALAR